TVATDSERSRISRGKSGRPGGIGLKSYMQRVPTRVHLFKSTRNHENLSGPARGRGGLRKLKTKPAIRPNRPMKKLSVLANIISAVATLTFVTGCASTSTTTTSASPQKESLLQQAGFHTLTVT